MSFAGVSSADDVIAFQVGDESHVTRKSVELGYYQGSLVLFCRLNRLGELGALRSFAALNLGELGYQLPRATVQIGLHSFPLSFPAETRSALLFCTHAVVGDESTLQPSGGFSSSFTCQTSEKGCAEAQQ